MCGISSVFKFCRVTEKDISCLAKMNKEMSYRGPDGNGIWHDDKCGLAHTRLSIIGVNNGSQPLFNEDGTLVLICNGEIYNYLDLKAFLQSKGHSFKTNSDSETILHLYEEYDTDCLQHLRGMFAFCLYDKRKGRLFASRYRVGEKTLYYAHIPCGIVFSTELKAIVKYYIDRPQVNPKLLAESIRFGYPIELRHTFIEQVNRLQAGEYALVDETGIELYTYWNRRSLPKFEGTKEEAKIEILRLMRESVANCLQSEVPVAVLLSGGIDSSAIAHFAKETGQDIHCICAGYKGSYSCDERSVAKQYAKQKGLIYHEVELDLDSFEQIYEEYLDYIDEPVADIASIAQWALYKKAKELGFKVLLGGLGGDELFYGYPIHNRCGEALKVRYQLDSTHSRAKWLGIFLKNLRFLDPHRRMRLDNRWPVDWTYSSYCKFSSTASIECNNKEILFKDLDVNYNYPYNSGVDTVYDLQFSRFMTTQCLYLADRLGMGNSLELRSPFVDYKLVEFVSSLPLSFKYVPGNPKGFMKEILSGIVPDDILYAPKRGFTPPIDYINELCRVHQYKKILGDYVFFNSMLADKVLCNLLK